MTYAVLTLCFAFLLLLFTFCFFFFLPSSFPSFLPSFLFFSPPPTPGRAWMEGLIGLTSTLQLSIIGCGKGFVRCMEPFFCFGCGGGEGLVCWYHIIMITSMIPCEYLSVVRLVGWTQDQSFETYTVPYEPE